MSINQELLNREMSRREFLVYLLGLIPLLAGLKMLLGSGSKKQGSSTGEGGYGSSLYGR